MSSTTEEEPVLRVAIVGRPNVGKSTLFNALAGRRIAITDARAGTTRDLVEADCRLEDEEGRALPVRLVDTGGMGIGPQDALGPEVEAQVRRGIQGADAVILLTDVRCGITELDRRAAEVVKHCGKPFLLAVNKCDGEKWEAESTAFFRLGCGEPVAVSALEKRNLDRLAMLLLQLLRERFPEHCHAAREVEADAGTKDADRPPGPMRLAVVGRRNAGKSTFFNQVAGYERVIVSEVPGTTRDAVEIEAERGGVRFRLVDTAGLARRREGTSPVEFYSAVRTEQAMRRADVVLLFLDCTVEIGRIERHAYRFAQEERRPLILTVNKWDLSTVEPERYLEYLEAKLPFARRFPVAFVSAREGTGIDELLQTARGLFEAAGRTLSTGRLNRLLKQLTREHQVPIRGTRAGRIYYVTQTGRYPPEFTLFVNQRALFGADYLRYLEGRLAEALGAPELPVRVVLRERERTRTRATKH